ncbi:MAG: glycosyltransferase family protein [Armatimonadota bacterium]
MNAVFTIVAKNYLPRAKTLGDSVKAIHPELPFYIFLSDELDGMIDLAQERFPIIEAKLLGIPQFRDMAFYYNLLEFSCAIKPFCFQYLAQHYGYEKVIYFDPDIYVYSSLDPIQDTLTDNYLVLTPHLTHLNQTAQGAMPEASFLFVGAYNLGFIALQICPTVTEFLVWWGDCLVDRGFADLRDALHVDQKWIDLVPGLLGEKVVISRDSGHNAAQWNMHERQLTCRAGAYYLNDRPLVFFHHTSFDPHNPARLAHRQSKFTLANRPEFTAMMEAYSTHLLSNGYDEYLKLPYKYARYDNGVNIFAFQRRMYRILVQERSLQSNPFATGTGTYYDVLRKNRLIIYDKSKAEFVQADFNISGRGVRWFKRGLIILKNLIGIKYYYLLIRWLYNNTRPEEQVFLIEKCLADLR